MRKQTWLLLGAIVLVSGLLGSLMLDRGHNWGDDFAQYIMQTQALASGRMAQYMQATNFVAANSDAVFPAPITVPWGLPLILAPVWMVFGTKLLAFKLVLTICYVLFLVAFFFLARTRLPTADSLLLTAVLALNALLLRAQNEILTDIPFLLFSTLALCLIERAVNRRESTKGFPYRYALIGLVIFMAALTRQNGFLLFIPLAVAYVRDGLTRSAAGPRRPILHYSLPLLVFLACYVLTTPLLPGSSKYILPDILPSGAAEAQPAAGAVSSSERVLANAWYYFWLPADLTDFTMYQGPVVYLALLFFAVLELRHNLGSNTGLLLYALAIFALYIVFGGQQGPRYIFPAFPILLLFAHGGLRWLTRSSAQAHRRPATVLVWVFWISLAASSMHGAVTYAVANMRAGRESSEGPYTAASLEMFSFIRNTTPIDATMIFYKPNAMRLLTGRNTFVTSRCRLLSRADYVILVKGSHAYQISPSKIGDCNRSVQLTRAYSNHDFVVFKIEHLR